MGVESMCGAKLTTPIPAASPVLSQITAPHASQTGPVNRKRQKGQQTGRARTWLEPELLSNSERATARVPYALKGSTCSRGGATPWPYQSVAPGARLEPRCRAMDGQRIASMQYKQTKQVDAAHDLSIERIGCLL